LLFVALLSIAYMGRRGSMFRSGLTRHHVWPSQGRLLLALLFDFLVVHRVAGERVLTHDEITAHGNLKDFKNGDAQMKLRNSQPELEDITGAIAVADSTGLARCCCDAHQRGTHVHTRTHESRSGICIFFPVVPGHRHHCSDLGRHARTWQSGVMHHYTHTESQKCVINRDESETVARELQRLHPTSDYCRGILPVTSLTAAHQGHHALVSVPAAPLGGTAAVSCQPGFEAAEHRVTCEINVVASGAFRPTPACERIPKWCPDMHDDSMRVVGAGVGQSRTVECAEGTSPEKVLITCGQDGVFHPAPNCVATAQFDVTLEAAQMEASGHGRCCCDMEHRHFTGMSRWMTGSSAHTGACRIVHDLEHCREIEGRNHWVHYRRTENRACVVGEQEYRTLVSED